MLTSKIENILEVLNSFTGISGEPKDVKEFYILKSMWVMLCAEFEGSIKNLVENYIDHIKKNKNMEEIHVCLLIQDFYGNKEVEITIPRIIGLFKRKKEDISYRNFTQNKKPTYKSFSVESLFNSLGIFFEEHEITALKVLDGIASTRDSIAHGDREISITRKELEENILKIKEVYEMLKNRLFPSARTVL